MKHKECRENGNAMNGVLSTLSSVILTVHLILNISNANNNNNNNNNNDNNDNNNNNVRVDQLVANSEFDNDYGTMAMGVGKSFPDFEDSESVQDFHISKIFWKTTWKYAKYCVNPTKMELF